MIRKTIEQCAGTQICQLAKAEAVRKLVQQHGNEIRLRAMVVVESQVEVEGAAEVRIDIVGGGQQIDLREFVCQRDVIPRQRERREGEVSCNSGWTSAAKDAWTEWRELSANTNRHVAVESRAPKIRRVLESD